MPLAHIESKTLRSMVEAFDCEDEAGLPWAIREATIELLESILGANAADFFRNALIAVEKPTPGLNGRFNYRTNGNVWAEVHARSSN